jgi:hypothetical protein
MFFSTDKNIDFPNAFRCCLFAVGMTSDDNRINGVSLSRSSPKKKICQLTFVLKQQRLTSKSSQSLKLIYKV